MFIKFFVDNNLRVEEHRNVKIDDKNFSFIFKKSSDKIEIVEEYLQSNITEENLSIILNYVLEHKNGKLLTKIFKCDLNSECVRMLVKRMRNVVLDKKILFSI